MVREENGLRRTNLFRACVWVTAAKLETCISGLTFLDGRIGPALIAVFFFLKLKQQSCINMFKLLLLLASTLN